MSVNDANQNQQLAHEVLDLIRKRVLKVRCSACPTRYPYDETLEPHQQQHPEFRRGGVNVCDSLLRYITRIEQELFVPEPPISLAAQPKLQTAPIGQCCKASQGHQQR
ncbi:hypothetical protein VA249_29650 [Vibrio alfacsensis]|uniref:hypothetical protein n=1 Tax=Vibrio alfacsensis TaxID=1074311 RepID=UPI001BF0B457|nr:hypothetical protein [Vibrio alfacsensis]BBM66319.1 hypothetical protein VA249_29650 [Vibrio alfacsensis]